MLSVLGESIEGRLSIFSWWGSFLGVVWWCLWGLASGASLPWLSGELMLCFLYFVKSGMGVYFSGLVGAG